MVDCGVVVVDKINPLLAKLLWSWGFITVVDILTKTLGKEAD